MKRAPPKSGEAPAGDAARGFRTNGKADASNCATTAGPQAQSLSYRAALLGLVLELRDGAWLLTYAAFGSAGHVCTLPSLQAVEAALRNFEQARSEVLALVRRAGVIR